MMISRGLKPEHNFAIIGNDLLRDASLSFRARGILCCVLSHKEGYRISSDRLSDMGTEGRDAIRSSLAELESSGYLKRTKAQDAHGHWVTTAVISDTPDLSALNTPAPGKPTTDFQAPVNQPSVSQALKEDQEEDKKKKKEKAPLITFNPETASFKDITEQQMQVWSSAYPKADVQQEIKRAAAWLFTNPRRAKENYARFLTNWINRSYGSAPAAGARGQPAPGQPTAYQATQERRANFMAAMTTQGEPDDHTPDFDFRDDARTVDTSARFVD